MSNSMPNDDQKILSQLSALHSRFMESPTRRAGAHIQEFIERSRFDITVATFGNLNKYASAINASGRNKFSPKSLTHLNTVAKDTLQ